MSKFKPGDILIGPMLGNKWKFIGTVDSFSYCVPMEDDSRTDAVEFCGDLDEWTLAPKPFFEEGKKYRLKRDPSYRAHLMIAVRGIEGERYAVSRSEGYLVFWRESEFENYEEVQ